MELNTQSHIHICDRAMLNARYHTAYISHITKITHSVDDTSDDKDGQTPGGNDFDEGSLQKLALLVKNEPQGHTVLKACLKSFFKSA